MTNYLVTGICDNEFANDNEFADDNWIPISVFSLGCKYTI